MSDLNKPEVEDAAAKPQADQNPGGDSGIQAGAAADPVEGAKPGKKKKEKKRKGEKEGGGTEKGRREEGEGEERGRQRKGKKAGAAMAVMVPVAQPEAVSGVAEAGSLLGSTSAIGAPLCTRTWRW